MTMIQPTADAAAVPAVHARQPARSDRVPALAGSLVLSLALWPPLAAAEQAPTASVYGSWSVACKGTGTSRRCAATQKVAADRTGEKVVLGVIVEPGRGAERRPQLTFRFTGKAYVPAGAGLKIDDREPLRAPITGCDAKVCEVRAWLVPELAEPMRVGRLLVFAYFFDEKRQISLPVSLHGFGRALDELERVDLRR